MQASVRRQPILAVISSGKRDQGKRAQRSNIQAGQAVSDIIRTTLGPKAMLKMILDPLGGIVLTSDGNAILREIDVGHPGAKTLIELSRAQDEEIGDGTTSVILVAGQLLSLSELLIEKQLHPTRIVTGFLRALEDILEILNNMATTLDPSNSEQLQHAIVTCLSTKFSSRWVELLPKLALTAAKLVCTELANGKKDIDIKKYVKVEKIPGGQPEDSQVIQGIILNKDVTHPKMRRKIIKPRIVLLDSPLEYKKGESQTNVEIREENHWEQLLQQEEEEIKRMCDNIIQAGCDVVVTEKGVSDLAQHFLVKAGISVIRRAKKSDNNRLTRVTGATIVSRTVEIRPDDIGYDCELFEIKKIGDEYYTFFVECKNPKACSIVLRGGSKDVLNETERNLQDALNVAKSLLIEPKILPGGGATELELSAQLSQRSSSIEGVEKWSYATVGMALEIIPQTLIQNCGCDVVRVITCLKAKHSQPGNSSFGINGQTGEICDVTKHDIWDAFATKQQVFKAGIEAAAMLLRIDDVLSTTSKKKNKEGGEETSNAMPEGTLDAYND